MDAFALCTASSMQPATVGTPASFAVAMLM